MKRFTLSLTMLAALVATLVVASPSAQAGLFGGNKSAASPSPSPSPSALPTATPEPPSVAIPKLQAKLKANPNDEDAMTELAGQFLGINRPDLSVQLTQHLLQMGDKTAQVYYLDGYAMETLGRTDGAIADLEQAENLDPSNSGVLDQLTELYLKANRFTDAERIANRSIVLNKGDASSYSLLGAVYASEQKFDDARTQFTIAMNKDPKDPEPIFQIAQTYASQDNIPVAQQWVTKALALDPKNVQVLVFRADLYARQHVDDQAVAAYDDAIVAAPDDASKVQIVIRKATYFATEKKYPQADNIFLQGITQYPKIPQIYVAYGDYLASQKNLDKAKTEWQIALAIDNDDLDALTRLGQLALQQGQYQDAVTYFKHVVSLQEDPTAFAMLGQAYSFLHDYQNSKQACQASFQLQRSADMLACIAGADYNLKNYTEASKIFDVLDANAAGYLDQNPAFLYLAGKSYEQTKQRDKAINAYRRLLSALKKGTKQYAQIQGLIADLSKPAPKPAKKP
ncbi:MAG TPA: tetratricopeptide repeat protein [Candidatus Acidoferrales bacterium]|nr:tetratricopeptide repeat protein [Candidatus Acidoferrales bacterium]